MSEGIYLNIVTEQNKTALHSDRSTTALDTIGISNNNRNNLIVM